MEPKKRRMIFFQYGRTCLESLGFMPKQRSLSWRLLVGLVVPSSNVFLNLMFLLYEANTFWEYTNAIFICMVTGVGFLLFTIFICQTERVFAIIDFAQRFFEKSKEPNLFHFESNVASFVHSQYQIGTAESKT